jgi:SagB-type dehydrogenase family enzyme
VEYEGIGNHFQQLTKYVRGSMRRHRLDWNRQPSQRKPYPEHLKKVALPQAATTGGPPLWDVIRERRSLRSYTRESLSPSHLSQLLWATQGTTLRVREFNFRSAPSAGALYPVETYVIANRVEGLTPGLYHFDAPDAFLQLVKEGAYGRPLAACALDQRMLEEAPAVFAWTALVERSAWKYVERAYRYIYLDAGHIAQNLYLGVTGLGLGCCSVGAFFDDEVNELLGVDGEKETVIYMAAVGKPR